MQRVLAARDEMRRREELKLADLAREAAAVREAQQRLDAYLARQENGGGPLFEHMARGHRSLHARAAALVQEHAATGARAQEQARQAKLAERRVEGLSAALRREDEKRALVEWIERLGGAATSLP